MNGRRIVIVRHGERVDFTFTDGWIKTCFSNNNTDTYTKQNLNMPDTVPKRDTPKSFLQDSPLTQLGELQAILIGKGLLEQNVLREGFEVYVSPALRCVQTSTGILKGMNLDLQMKVEPDLFEFMHWFRNFKPSFMTIEELKENGFSVDKSYIPLNSKKDDEGIEEFYERSYRLIQHLIESTDKDLLLVAHGILLDTLTRQLLGTAIRTVPEMMALLRMIPYCGTAIIEQDKRTNKWSFISIPQMSLKHGTVQDFDAAKVLEQGL